MLVGCRWGGEGRFPRAVPPSSGLGARGEERELVSGSGYTQRGEGKLGGRALVGTSLSSQSPGWGEVVEQAKEMPREQGTGPVGLVLLYSSGMGG